ncbi:MAG TPA: metal-dependent hydrolase [Rudaea sp.]|nr:metal-dependent hydrolase [Rudaea sp.]
MRLVKRGLPLRWLVLGGLLPDLIDKPLYYSLVFATGKRGTELGLISGTRTFGHTGLFLLLFVGLWAWRRSPSLAAIAWGIASHLLLDNIGDLFGERNGPTAFDALMFPLLGAHFPISFFKSIKEHLLSVRNLYVGGGEVAGALLLLWSWLQSRRRLHEQPR